MDIVKPGSHLSDILDDEIRRVVLLKLLFIVKGIMQLSKRHRARLKPAVQHLVHPLKMFAVDVKGDGVNPGAMVVIQLRPT